MSRGRAAQGREGAPNALIEVLPSYMKALHRMQTGDEIIIIGWLHRSQRNVMEVHPRGDASRPLTGVFSTRSPDRPNPIGLHRVKSFGSKSRSFACWSNRGNRWHPGDRYKTSDRFRRLLTRQQIQGGLITARAKTKVCKDKVRSD